MTEKSGSKFKNLFSGKKEDTNKDWDRNVFLANMSREIRTPLNVIISMSELLSSSETLNDKEWDYANMIYSASKNLLAIMDDIADYSKYSDAKFDLINESYSLYELSREVDNIIRPKADEKKLSFYVSVDPRIPERMIGDAGRVRQIVLNLLNNAVQYTDVGFVELKIGYRPLDDEKSQIIFIVSDSGIGIKDKELKILFDELIQIDPKKNQNKEGTGLGLAIARQLCELMDGNIRVTSEFGTGSTFAATIVQEIDPNYEKEEKIISLSDNNEEIGRFNAPAFKVLAVDDNNINLKVIVELLKQYGINADTAASGQEALNLVKSNKYNMIFMDYVMPEMDGKETTRQIRNLEGCNEEVLPIVALTADVISSTKEELIECGMNDYLAKPVKSDDIKQILGKFVPLNLRVYSN